MFQWAESNIRRMSVWAFGMTKLSVIFFTLMIAKLLPAVLRLEWYWYALVAVVAQLAVLVSSLGKTSKS